MFSMRTRRVYTGECAQLIWSDLVQRIVARVRERECERTLNNSMSVNKLLVAG